MAGRAGRGGGPARCQASPRRGEVRRSRGGLLLPALAAASRCRSSKFTAGPAVGPASESYIACLHRHAHNAPPPCTAIACLHYQQPVNPPCPWMVVACAILRAGTDPAPPSPPPSSPSRAQHLPAGYAQPQARRVAGCSASSQTPPGGAVGRGAALTRGRCGALCGERTGPPGRGPSARRAPVRRALSARRRPPRPAPPPCAPRHRYCTRSGGPCWPPPGTVNNRPRPTWRPLRACRPRSPAKSFRCMPLYRGARPVRRAPGQ